MAMDYRIIEQDSFEVVGKAIEVTCRGGENLRRIPQFWAECSQNGTVERIAALGSDCELLGLCLDMKPNLEDFTYLIASRYQPATDREVPADFEVWTIPKLTWAVFPSLGPLPGSLQSLFGRIFQEWLPVSGYSHAAGPEIEVYPPGDTSASDYRCEVWIPVV